MTAKQKAKQLVDDNICIDYYRMDFYDLDFDYLTEIMKYDPREYALNRVNLILKTNCILLFWKKKYWKQVKQEIQQLCN